MKSLFSKVKNFVKPEKTKQKVFSSIDEVLSCAGDLNEPEEVASKIKSTPKEWDTDSDRGITSMSPMTAYIAAIPLVLILIYFTILLD